MASVNFYPQNTFRTTSPLWTTRRLHNERKATKSLNDIDEAKFEAFNSMSFKSICFGLEYAGIKRWLHLPVGGQSLLHIFSLNRYIKTSLGKSAWRSLVPDSSLQKNCNREGINVKWDGNQEILARIGITSNNENECKTQDSAIGAGLRHRTNYCGTTLKPMSSGNIAGCLPDNGDKALPGTSYLLIK